MRNQNQVYPEEEDPFTCEICIQPFPLPYKFRNSDKCVHPFCSYCMIRYIYVKLVDNVSDIKCPANTCNHSLEPLSCRPIISPQLFDKWYDVLCESRVNRVYCPNRECSELISSECGDGDLKRCICPRCQKPFCFGCKVPWHDGSTCEEHAHKQDPYDVAFDVLYHTHIWRCPRCARYVEHVNGYTVIALKCRCGTRRFCLKCGKDNCWHTYRDRVGFIIILLCHALFTISLIKLKSNN